jgi:hypothetical protein
MSDNPHGQRFHHDQDLEQGGIPRHSSGVELSKKRVFKISALLWALRAIGLGLWLQTFHCRPPATPQIIIRSLLAAYRFTAVLRGIGRCVFPQSCVYDERGISPCHLSKLQSHASDRTMIPPRALWMRRERSNYSSSQFCSST